MQEIQFICGGDRRLRLHHHHQPLKCPRCDSPNTKFCYYNNYNLSQPRHFCKNCRRYWTKGGVLRNIPVGGCCRKSKRSNNPSSSSDTPPVTPPLPSQPPPEPDPNSNSHSSSESSTLTVAATETMSPPTTSDALLLDNNVPDSKSGAIFSDSYCFNALINSNNEPLGFGFNNMLDTTTSFRFGVTRQEFGTASFLDHTVPLQSSSSLQHNSWFGSLDWQPSLFDLPNTVDQPYCSNTSSSHQVNNPSLFHLP